LSSEPAQAPVSAARPEPARRGRGLTNEEALRRLEQYGRNALPVTPPPPLWLRFLRQLRSALIYVLLFALAVDLGAWILDGAAGVPVEALAIAAILLLNAGLGVWQEYRADDALARLRELEEPQVWVLRDGHLVQLASRDLVPGDVVRVSGGGRIPADGRVQSESGLLVDESILTGESVPVDKAAGSSVFSGTLAARGTAYVEVTATGLASNMGRIAGMLREVRSDRTPLERRLDAFGNRVALWVAGISVALVAGGVWAEGWQHFDKAFVWAVALAVAAVPEGLPAVLTLTLALGVERMSRRRAVVRKLVAVEALGSVTVIATDKTGTLTENRMLVREVDTPDLARALRAVALANEAEPDTGAGDPLETGLYAFAREHGVDPLALRQACPRQSTRAFDSAWKFMRVTVREDGALVSYLKGAPEVLLARTSLTAEERREWSERARAACARGMRVLALAWAPGESEQGLEWLGLVLFWDPPRAEIAGAVRAAYSGGVRILMMTGDHPETAASIARMVGIDGGRCLCGTDLEGLPPEVLRERVADTTVFARVTPEHKLALVEALGERGEIVAVTGDGVNDALALKRADVGVAMGMRGSDVSREVADLVLLDDNFATIVAAIEEGRNVYENIQSFIHFLFSTNLALVLLVAFGAIGSALLDLRDAQGLLLVPLTAAQLLWVNVIANGPPALAVGIDRTPDVMRRAPRPKEAGLLEGPGLRFVLISGCVKAAVGLSMLLVLPAFGLDVEATRTAVFLYESLAPLAFVYPSRQLALRRLPNRVLDAVVVVSVLLQPAIVYLPGLRGLLGLTPLELSTWGFVAGGVLLSWLFADLYCRRLRARSDREAGRRTAGHPAGRSPSA
jgi:Ca2+-transporting ATPase